MALSRGAKRAGSPSASRRESGVHRLLWRPEGGLARRCQISVITAPWLSGRSRSACLCHGHVQAPEWAHLAGHLGDQASPFRCPLSSRLNSQRFHRGTFLHRPPESVPGLISTRSLGKPTEQKVIQPELIINPRELQVLFGHLCPLGQTYWGLSLLL